MRILDQNRSNYQRKFADEGKCVFCQKNDILTCNSLAGKYWQVIVNQFPYMDGNVMLVPVRHVEKIEGLKKEEWEEFGSVLAKTQKILGKIFETDSFNVALNVGLESGASIPHLHWQIIPRRFKNITVMNTFADLYIVAVTPEKTQRLIEEALKNTDL